MNTRSSSGFGLRPKRHQTVPGHWHNLATLAHWCRTESYLDSATATASRTQPYP
jgi:hypothetical protein